MSSANIVKNNGQLLTDLGDGTRIVACDNEPMRSTYALFLTGIAPAANATDFLTIAASTKLLRIKSISMAGTATAASNIIVNLLRRTTANTGGTSSPKTIVPRDTNNDPSTAAALLYSVNPTGLGTTIGAIDGGRLNLAPPANGGIDRLNFQLSWLNDQALVIRPGETLAINQGGAAWPAGGLLDMSVVWTEENVV